MKVLTKARTGWVRLPRTIGTARVSIRLFQEFLNILSTIAIFYIFYNYNSNEIKL
jgi:hypothetical protein